MTKKAEQYLTETRTRLDELATQESLTRVQRENLTDAADSISYALRQHYETQKTANRNRRRITSDE